MPNRLQIDAPPIAPPPAALVDPRLPHSDSNAPTSGTDTTNCVNYNAPPPLIASTASDSLDSNVASVHLGTNDRGTLRLRRSVALPFLPLNQERLHNPNWAVIVARMPAALVSFIVHTILLLILALLTVAPRVGVPTSHSLESATGEGQTDQEIDQTVEILASGDAIAAPSASVTEVRNVPAPSEEVLRQLLGEFQKIDPSATKTSTAQTRLSSTLSEATSDFSLATLAATGVEGRSVENRDRTAKARGGTLESELAVERALDWLAAHQLPSGGWSLVHDGGKCNGQCKNNGSDARYEPAATGLALLAFLGAGYTHTSGKHQRTVHDGIYYLLQIMEEAHNTGSFLHQSERGMYNHGIAAFALCEAYQLSGDKDLKNPAQLAVNFICSAQNYAGGWGYLPKQPGDLTISGWQMMAIKSAHAAGLEVPPMVIIRIDHFLDTKQVSSGIYYGYGKPEQDPTCSAIGVLLRLFRGWSHTDPRALELAQFLVKKGRSNGDVYYNYYATLLLFHLGGPAWETWNPRIREHLVKTQNQSGHEAGSWYFEDQYAKEGGRLYTTAMCAMTLEVYYRFAPLYQQSDRPFEL